MTTGQRERVHRYEGLACANGMLAVSLKSPTNDICVRIIFIEAAVMEDS